MSHEVPTVRVKPWSSDQGEFVVINEADFDPDTHVLFEAADAAGTSSQATQAPRRGRTRKDAPNA